MLQVNISPHILVLLVRITGFFYPTKVRAFALEVCPSYQPDLQASAKTVLPVCLPVFLLECFLVRDSREKGRDAA